MSSLTQGVTVAVVVLVVRVAPAVPAAVAVLAAWAAAVAVPAVRVVAVAVPAVRVVAVAVPAVRVVAVAVPAVRVVVVLVVQVPAVVGYGCVSIADTGFNAGNFILNLTNNARVTDSVMRRVILRNFQSPGDIVMLTAVIRDLHWTHPGQFQTDVRTSCPALWENNPHITPLDERMPGIETVDCEYPLIHASNHRPYHFIHGFRIFLQQRLQVEIIPHEFRGDIHLAEEEKGWLSQIDEITGEANTRFWIIVSGGKKDFTAKWWDHERAQEVVDYFQGRIQFVQCGDQGDNHAHPPLRNVIDLLGKTDMRQMVRLMYHAEGVVCPVTMFMHLAAAVEAKTVGGKRSRNRPCVVVAGGREPPHWEAYPHHSYLHTNGCLPCCDAGGCWKSRVVPLGDGDSKDADLCLFPVRLNSGRYLPKCLDMITAADVIRAIERYLEYSEMNQFPEVVADRRPVSDKDETLQETMYNPTIHDHFAHPRRVGTFPDADATGRSGIPGQGNFMVLYLKINEQVIQDARFQTYGCPAAIASGSWISEWLVGKSLAEAEGLTAASLCDGLGGLPLGREHCADLAVTALQNALRGYMDRG